MWKKRHLVLTAQLPLPKPNPTCLSEEERERCEMFANVCFSPQNYKSYHTGAQQRGLTGVRGSFQLNTENLCDTRQIFAKVQWHFQYSFEYPNEQKGKSSKEKVGTNRTIVVNCFVIISLQFHWKQKPISLLFPIESDMNLVHRIQIWLWHKSITTINGNCFGLFQTFPLFHFSARSSLHYFLGWI